ncbi:MAG TPA: response regulator [Mucilaginibacter sp.]
MKKAIAIFESDPDVLDMMKMILSDEGYLVIASAGCLTVAEIGGLMPHLILMDYRLTVGRGQETCMRLKENPYTAGIQINVVSANAIPGPLSLESHPDGFLSKPFDINDLIRLASAYTERIH